MQVVAFHKPFDQNWIGQFIQRRKAGTAVFLSSVQQLGQSGDLDGEKIWSEVAAEIEKEPSGAFVS